jgi:hypothetical protein
MKTKRFDCVDMMHRGAERIYRATKDMSHEEELEFWRGKAAPRQENPVKPARKASPKKKRRSTGQMG